MIAVYRRQSVCALPPNYDEGVAHQIQELMQRFLHSDDCRRLVTDRLGGSEPVRCKLIFSDRDIEVLLASGRRIVLAFQGEDTIEVGGQRYSGCRATIGLSKAAYAMTRELVENAAVDTNEENLA